MLQEETYFIGEQVKTQMTPSLLVSSHQVKTSHGTKIQRIPIETLFYLQSRGLSLQHSKKFFVESLFKRVLAPLELSEKEEGEIKQFIQ
ncbi:SufD family Fe-S cluster assembly protein [bacterium]|nr:SufD family Fe-S cluster assembly protein [bacterium]